MSETQALATQIASGNPGAMKICHEIASHDAFASLYFELLRDQSITGAEIWYLWEACSKDLTTFQDTLTGGKAIEKLAQVEYSKFYVKEQGNARGEH